ncbi:MAG TPA: ATP-binding protein [Castellaniella sp.]|uniref:ATP-binding protein n=1 Tax=Castellaniella sp. TaxID=1955812 RepID=UPI002EE9BC8B
MAGFKTRLKDLRESIRSSIQFRLSLILSLVILAMAVVAGVFSFRSALHEAHKLQDNILYQIAGTMQLQPAPLVHVLQLRDHDDDSQIVVWPLRPDQPELTVRKDHRDALPLPNNLSNGRHTLTLGNETYRVMVRQNDGGQRVAVAQEIHFRDRIALNSALRTVTPFLIFVPILVLIVIFLVRQMFRPVKTLSAQIDGRDEQDLRPISDRPLLTEVRPFVRAINRLLGRVSQSMEAQRRFVADAAHELRSPMTALSLQAERLAQSDMPAAATERLTELRTGIERVRKLLNQLLALAHVQSSSASRPSAEVSIQQVYRQVLEDLMPQAEARRIDVGLEGDEDARIEVNDLDLTTLVKNLLDNAIRYTPEGGRVDLAITREPNGVTLHVADTGPGIAPAERTRVFDPFYRILGSGQTGSGLGLAIVHTLVKRMGACITLDYTDPGRQVGLHVRVHFPIHRLRN